MEFSMSLAQTGTISPPTTAIMQIEHVPPGMLHAHPRNARQHSKKQIKALKRAIREFGFTVPIVLDEQSVILAGHARLIAALELGLAAVPVIRVKDLSDARKRAYMLADNRIAEGASWDFGILAEELELLSAELALEGLDLEVTGFSAGEVNQVLDDRGKERPDPADDLPKLVAMIVTRRGDIWLCGGHRILCDDALLEQAYRALMRGQRAAAAFVDKPYNVAVNGHVGGRGAVKHAEFQMASGEMTREQFRAFALKTDQLIVSVMRDGGIVYSCIDWRSLDLFVEVAREAYGDLLNIVVWNKTNAGQGSFYRSQHELILVLRVGTTPHRNGVELGKHGRNRSNVWTYPGVNTFRKGRMEELASHPTVKPVALVADALKDCTMPHEIVLDTFLGSGTTLLAAEKVGRRCYGMEIEPRYVDVAVQRWQAVTKLEATLEATGETFAEVMTRRALEAVGDDRAPPDDGGPTQAAVAGPETAMAAATMTAIAAAPTAEVL
jgi:DNA modification methylase